jgi:F0F1-type ATP synthase membrane subunit c/vacuolar-type H+-ATPase subunit K
MDRNLVIFLIFGCCILGPCVVFSVASYASIQALGRNPSSAPKIFTGMVIALASAMAVSIIAMLVCFQMLGPQT